MRPWPGLRIVRKGLWTREFPSELPTLSSSIASERRPPGAAGERGSARHPEPGAQEPEAASADHVHGQRWHEGSSSETGVPTFAPSLRKAGGGSLRAARRKWGWQPGALGVGLAP